MSKLAGEMFSLGPLGDWQNEVDPSIFFRGESLCHTARLPAEIRYLGYLTNTDKVGGPAVFGKEQYDVGVEFHEDTTVSNVSTSGLMQLGWSNEGGTERQIGCSVIVKPDYKDYFFVREGDGWAKMIFPNDKERIAYGYDPSKMHGIILILFKSCDWGKCAKNFLQGNDLNEGKKWEMKINGIPVEMFHTLGGASMPVNDKKGIRFLPDRKYPYYEIEIKVNHPNSYVKISSIILF